MKPFYMYVQQYPHAAGLAVGAFAVLLLAGLMVNSLDGTRARSAQARLDEQVQQQQQRFEIASTSLPLQNMCRTTARFGEEFMRDRLDGVTEAQQRDKVARALTRQAMSSDSIAHLGTLVGLTYQSTILEYAEYSNWVYRACMVGFGHLPEAKEVTSAKARL